jgi:hypothetical protein
LSKPLLPPRGIFASTRLVFHRRLPASLKETALQLMALAWGNEQHCTPPLTYLQLAEMTGKDPRTLRGHLRALRSQQAVLNMHYTTSGIFSVTLASWLFRNEPVGRAELGQEGLPRDALLALESDPELAQPSEKLAAGDIAPGSVLKDGDGAAASMKAGAVVAEPTAGIARWIDPAIPAGTVREPSSPAEAQLPPGRLNAETQLPEAQEAPVAKRRRAASLPVGDKPRSERTLSQAIQKELLAGGVFPTLLPEVTASSYSEVNLRALLAWCRIDAPDEAARLFIGRMRAGAQAPRAYHGKPCDVCGHYGKHKPGCRRSYAQDIYASP